MEAVLTEKSVKLIAVMLSEPKIKAAVYEKLDHTEKYKIYTLKELFPKGFGPKNLKGE